MQTKYTVKISGKTFFYTTMEEAIQMCRFAGVSVNSIKTVDLW